MTSKKIIKNEKVSLKEKAKISAVKFHKEFSKAINTAIMAAFGFLIALVWKDVITGFVDSISQRSPVQGKLFSALIVTIICVLGIMLLAKLFSEDKEEK